MAETVIRTSGGESRFSQPPFALPCPAMRFPPGARPGWTEAALASPAERRAKGACVRAGASQGSIRAVAISVRIGRNENRAECDDAKRRAFPGTRAKRKRQPRGRRSGNAAPTQAPGVTAVESDRSLTVAAPQEWPAGEPGGRGLGKKARGSGSREERFEVSLGGEARLLPELKGVLL